MSSLLFYFFSAWDVYVLFVEEDWLKKKVKNNVFIMCLDKAYILSA